MTVGGGALPAVRVELNPKALAKYDLGFDQVRTVLAAANANRPKGQIADATTAYEIGATDQLFTAAEYLPLVVSFRGGAAIRLADVGETVDSVQDVRVTGLTNGKPSVQLQVFREPGANIIETVDRVKALIPELRALLPPTIDLAIAVDRTTTIRASVSDVERTLLVAIGLVVLVVFVFLRSARATLIPGHRRAAIAPRHVRRHVLPQLQPRQPVADGVDHLDRLRRGRCDRRDRKREPASGHLV